MKANATLIKQVIGMVILFALVLAAVVFAEISFNNVLCKGVEITLDSENEKALLSKKDIKLIFWTNLSRRFPYVKLKSE
jgi:cytochrome c oxidase assembly protein Cox11